MSRQLEGRELSRALTRPRSPWQGSRLETALGGGCDVGETKRLLGIVASFRRGGNCESLTLVALRAAAARGAETAIIYLRDLRIEFCDGCLDCVFKGGVCHRHDDVHWLYETARGYDGIVLASPTYLLGAPGQVKALTDRSVAEFARNPGRRPRPVGTICVAGLPGWDYLVRPMTNQLAAALGGRLVGSLTAYAPGPGEALLDREVVSQAEELGTAVLEDRALPPPEGVCAVCGFPRSEAASGPCPFCLCDPVCRGGPHRFTDESLTRFLTEWMLPSRERFLARRHKIKEARGSLESCGVPVVEPPKRNEAGKGGG